MELSYELISQFAKQIANKDKETNKESTVYGTIRVDANGNKYVMLDGSDQLTPLTDDERPSVDATTTNATDGDRVSVLIKNHTATVTGNISSPSARTDDVEKIADDVSDIQEFDIMIGQQVQADKAYFKKLLGDEVTLGKLEASEASILELLASSAEIDKLLADKIKVTDLIATKIDADLVVADKAIIDSLKASDADIMSLVAEKAVIDKLIADKVTLRTLMAEEVAAKYATIGELNAVSAEIDNLDAKYITADQVSAEYATIENLNVASGKIENLETEMFDAETGNIKFANIDFSNIGEAAITKLYAGSGLIKDLVVGDGKITGELVGVTIKGDLIEGNTIKADKLVVKGSDGLYYKLNVGAGATTSEEVTEEELQNGLHGSAIIAKTITAEQISVKDLVAFDATIGGFTIMESALYSGAKTSVGNTTRGTYLDKDGQVAFGDGTNYLKYYRNADGTYTLDISAASIKFGSSGKSIESALQDTNAAIEQNSKQIALRATKTEVADSINNIEIGGKNMLLDSKGDFSTAGQTCRYGWIYLGIDTYRHGIPLESGQTYTMSFDWEVDWGDVVPPDNVVVNSWVGLGEQGGDWDYDVYGKTILTDATITSGKVVLTFTPPEAGLAKYPYFSMWPIRTSTEKMLDGSTWIIRNLKLEKGNKATDWTPSLDSFATKEEIEASIKVEADKITSTVSKNYQMVGSRGEQLVTNGNGLLGDNTNFSTLTFDGAVSNNSPGSFTYPTLSRYVVPETDEFIPVNTDKRYTISVDAKTQKGLATLYAFLMFYDADKNKMGSMDYTFVPGSLTSLTQDLKNGDTVVHLADVSKWVTETGLTIRNISFWNYTNSFGYTYPPETYTRNTVTMLYGNDSNPGDRAIDYNNNTVTLLTPWSGETIAAGTKVSAGCSGGTYKYLVQNVKPPVEWKTYSGDIVGVDYSGRNKDGMFPPGTAYAKVAFLWNIDAVDDQLWVTNITLQDTTVDKELSDRIASAETRIVNAETSITQTNDKIALCATKTEVENIHIGGTNLLQDSEKEVVGTGEFVQYADIAPIFDEYGSVEYTISFDIKSADVSQKNTVMVYCQNGTGAKYDIGSNHVPVTTEYTRQSITVTPVLSQTTQTESWLAFYGTYNTGNYPSVKNVKIERGNKATDWTPAPEDVDSAIDDAQSTANNAFQRVITTEASIELLSNSISTLVTDKNGKSLMTQTEDGWTFSMEEISSAVASLTSNVESLQKDSDASKADVDILKHAVDDQNDTLEYVRIVTRDDKPCIELGEDDSDLKQLITNSASQIMDGENVVTKMDIDGIETENVAVRNEIRQGQWAWVVHGNGNLGLMWKEVSD